MASLKLNFTFLLVLAILVLLPSPVAAFGAGNIASISKLEGKNWRHGDIEDMLMKVSFFRGHKWTSAMIKRVYFGNWLRDYSQAVDVGTLKGVQSASIRILVWVLGFMSFGYATREFEVTEERLGVYRPEEHLDNPVGYPNDAQTYDARLRPAVRPIESEIDPHTGMKNYLANESGDWATGSGYVKHSLNRAIHFGRVYTSGTHSGKEEDLFEALRCLGQALHCLEDFGAHTNYVELALREQGFHNVFPHCGSATTINIRGKHIYPLVTGTFGGVDFVHSVLGEATDHVSSSEVDEVNTALVDALNQNKRSGSSTSLRGLTDVLDKVPGTGNLIQEARQLQSVSDAQESTLHASQGTMNDPYNMNRASATSTFQGPPGTVGGGPAPGIPGMSMDPEAVVAKIYPILVFRDNVVRQISMIISKIPGLEALLDKIIERVTLFALSLLAPFVIPIINAISKSLKTGSSTIVDASGKSQFQVWEQPNCSDPTHSMLSKDHFSNTLNEPAGKVASAILQYVVPRVIYAMEHPDVPVGQVHDDVLRVFHHPALRDPHLEIHRTMFSVVEQWVQQLPNRGSDLDHLLGSESVKAGKNHHGGNQEQGHSHGGLFSTQSIPGFGSHSKVSGSPFEMFTKKRELDFAEEPLPDTPGPEHYGQGQYPQPSYGQPGSSYVPQAGYAQQSFQPQGGGGPPASDPYAYSVGTSYQQGYNDGGYQQQQQPQQQQPQQQHPQHPQPGQPGTYGQPYGEQYPPAQQGPYGKY